MWAGRGRDVEMTTGPPIIIAAFEMSSRQTYAVLFIASILVLQYVTAQSDDMYEFQRAARAPKFIRFGRGGGAKFIRFGRSGSNTWVS
ncbi:FMRFamide-like neuropeptide 5 family protein, partial [Necator americanus]